jgi:hypothetical protein
MRPTTLIKAAGWILTGLGAVHVVVAPFDTRKAWARVAAEGWWGTFSIDRAVTREALERSEAFWVTAGSFGVPVLALGMYILRSASRREPVPAWLGWMLLAYGVFCGIVLPRSPIWAIPVSGALIVIGVRDGRE